MNENRIVTLNREAWLQEAVSKIRPIFQGFNYKVPEVQVSVGWPSSGGLSTKKRTIGQCFYGATTADGKPQIYISPLLDEVAAPMGVLATLVHELAHTVAGFDAKHGPHFKKVAYAVGLEGKPTSTNATEDSVERYKQILEDLGAFPHARIVPSDKSPKKQTTRMLKCQCRDCDYVVRTVKTHIEKAGPPICPCNTFPMGVVLPDDADETLILGLKKYLIDRDPTEDEEKGEE